MPGQRYINASVWHQNAVPAITAKIKHDKKLFDSFSKFHYGGKSTDPRAHPLDFHRSCQACCWVLYTGKHAIDIWQSLNLRPTEIQCRSWFCIYYIYANMSSDYIKYLFLVALEICRLIGPHRWWLSSTICHLCSAIRLSAQHHHRSALQSLWWRFLVMDLARECMVDRIRCHKCTCCMYFRIHPCMRSLSSKKHIYSFSHAGVIRGNDAKRELQIQPLSWRCFFLPSTKLLETTSW